MLAMTILVAVADSLGFKGSIMAIYLYKNKQNHCVFSLAIDLKMEFYRRSLWQQVTEGFASVEAARDDRQSLRSQADGVSNPVLSRS